VGFVLRLPYPRGKSLGHNEFHFPSTLGVMSPCSALSHFRMWCESTKNLRKDGGSYCAATSWDSLTNTLASLWKFSKHFGFWII
jgi:hypothetical protein